MPQIRPCCVWGRRVAKDKRCGERGRGCTDQSIQCFLALLFSFFDRNKHRSALYLHWLPVEFRFGFGFFGFWFYVF